MERTLPHPNDLAAKPLPAAPEEHGAVWTFFHDPKSLPDVWKRDKQRRVMRHALEQAQAAHSAIQEAVEVARLEPSALAASLPSAATAPVGPDAPTISEPNDLKKAASVIEDIGKLLGKISGFGAKAARMGPAPGAAAGSHTQDAIPCDSDRDADPIVYCGCTDKWCQENNHMYQTREFRLKRVMNKALQDHNQNRQQAFAERGAWM